MTSKEYIWLKKNYSINEYNIDSNLSLPIYVGEEQSKYFITIKKSKNTYVGEVMKDKYDFRIGHFNFRYSEVEINKNILNLRDILVII